jgi:hypothetical protein
MLTIEEKRLKKRLYMVKWRALHPERAKELVKNAEAKKPEKYREMNRLKYLRWKLEKPEQLKAIQQRAVKKWRVKHREQWLESNRTNGIKWRKVNKELTRKYGTERKARKRGAEGKFTLKEWEDLKKEYNYICPACLKLEPEIMLTVDHITPLIDKGTNYISNIQPLCLHCNLVKNRKTIKYSVKGQNTV